MAKTIVAHTICPASFTIGLRFLRSSVSPRMYISTHPVTAANTPLSMMDMWAMNLPLNSATCASTSLYFDEKTARDTIIPARMAMPPNLGMAVLCMRLPSLGISMAPIFGATFIATGVTMTAAMNATKKVSAISFQSSAIGCVTFYSPNITILSPASVSISTDSWSG